MCEYAQNLKEKHLWGQFNLIAIIMSKSSLNSDTPIWHLTAWVIHWLQLKVKWEGGAHKSFHCIIACHIERIIWLFSLSVITFFVSYHMNFGTSVSISELNRRLSLENLESYLNTLKYIWILFLRYILPALFLGLLQHFGLLYTWIWINSSHTWIK